MHYCSRHLDFSSISQFKHLRGYNKRSDGFPSDFLFYTLWREPWAYWGLLVKIVHKIGAVFVYWSKIVHKCGYLPAFMY